MPHRLVPKRIRDHFGRRGVVLLLFGLAWLVQGAAVLTFGDTMVISNPVFWHERLPYLVSAAIWICSGLGAVVASLRNKRNNDTFGFLAVSFPPMVLAVSYGTGILSRSLLGQWEFALLGLYGFALWGVISLGLAVIASWAGEDEEVRK